MRTSLRTLTASLVLGLALTGCTSVGTAFSTAPVSGTVVEKEYDEPKTEPKYKEKCTTKNNRRTCKKVQNGFKTTPAEWDITVKDAQGRDHEIDVPREVYDSVEVGDPFTER